MVRTKIPPIVFRPLAALLLLSGTMLLAGTVEQEDGRALRPTDELLEQRVVAALAADPVVESFELIVTVTDGTVLLNGAVDTDEERARAGSVAADIEGVVEVENQITVAKTFVSPDRSDSEIRREVLDEAAELTPEVSIAVAVEDGFATISGTVSSREARRSLTEIAFRAGALLVKNQLRIERE